MKIFHLIPADEDGVHDLSSDCACDPKMISEERKEEAPEWLQGRTAFEHHAFSPIQEDKDGWQRYTSYEE